MFLSVINKFFTILDIIISYFMLHYFLFMLKVYLGIACLESISNFQENILSLFCKIYFVKKKKEI